MISERTVGAHISRILDKLGLTNRTQAALYAMREGLGGPARGLIADRQKYLILIGHLYYFPHCRYGLYFSHK